MKNIRERILWGIHICLIFVLALLFYAASGFKTEDPYSGRVRIMDHMMASVDGGPAKEVMLPHSFKGLKKRTPVVLTGEISVSPDESVYLKSVYSPAKIYLNGRMVHEFGKKENYPAFMLDPATEIQIIELEEADVKDHLEIRMEFLSPVSRNTLVVHAPLVGVSEELIAERQSFLGLSMSFSLIQIFIGIGLMLISFFIMFYDKKGIVFMWLGLFSLATGVWAFGENNFTYLIIKHTALLYMMSFTGLFVAVIPLLRFVRAIVEFKNPKPVWWMETIMTFSAATALLLQLLGLVSCSTSMFFFHLALPVVMLLLLIFTIREAFVNHNLNAKKLSLSIAILFVSAVLELFNYRLHFTYVYSSVFQIGILLFLLIMGITGGMFIKDGLDLQNRRRELAFEKSLMNIELKEQESRSRLLAQNEQLISQQRHDLRHQLAVIRNLASEDNEELKGYLDTLMDDIPKARKQFCENPAVNALAAHYDAICRQRGIELTMNLIVPADNQHLSDNSLGIIFGNLLENAVDACGRMTEGRRFIKINSRLHNKLLVITMDNSFNGEIKKEGDRFFSSKRDEFGIGLSSIRSVVEKAQGDVEFYAEGQTFLSSVYVRI